MLPMKLNLRLLEKPNLEIRYGFIGQNVKTHNFSKKNYGKLAACLEIAGKQLKT